MILTGLGIKEQVESGSIVISDFTEDRLGPNSYNVRLGNELKIYKEFMLDMKLSTELSTIEIPYTGYTLFPNRLYLAQTMEYTSSSYYVPMLEGRSSIGRLGMKIHITAGFGDIGFKGYWTLEIEVVQPLKIYSGVEVGQLYFIRPDGPISEDMNYNGKYYNNSGIQGSKLWEEFKR